MAEVLLGMLVSAPMQPKLTGAARSSSTPSRTGSAAARSPSSSGRLSGATWPRTASSVSSPTSSHTTPFLAPGSAPSSPSFSSASLGSPMRSVSPALWSETPLMARPKRVVCLIHLCAALQWSQQRRHLHPALPPQVRRVRQDGPPDVHVHT
jgi:hypothetical protein